jgi:hypothetical protein
VDTALYDVLASFTRAPKLLVGCQVVPPGPGSPQRVGVHDAEVVPGLQGMAGSDGDLKKLWLIKLAFHEACSTIFQTDLAE